MRGPSIGGAIARQGGYGRSVAHEPIADLDDPRLDDYRSVREAELVLARGRFIAEGRSVVQTLLSRGRFRARSVLISEKKRGALEVPAEVPVYVVSQALMDRLVGFAIHRGILAIGERGPPPSPEALLDRVGSRSTILAIEAVSNHDNIGGLFRNAAGLGADLLLLDPRSADPLYRKAIRVSMGTALELPFARLDPWLNGLAQLRARRFALWALTPHGGADDLGRVARGEVPLPERVAWLVGAEGDGLSAETLERVDARWRVPMARGVDSLNVATAAALALFAGATGRGAPA
ncbi:MAG: RNA methyltransferase [Deltaproteobacteria bacterium]|nr:RNA methyltransferase [Deltaproteobacteria bacterium]